MAIIQYPVFVEGQTLTDADLNELRDALDGKDQTLGRLIGFGINCGLDGAIAGRVLTIGSGRAIDQEGQACVVDGPLTFDLPPAVTIATPPDFLETAPGGFTPVLTVTATEIPAVKCNEAGCEGHASQRKLDSTITLYPGRLNGAIVDFSDEPLLAREPVLVRKTGTINGAFVALRDAIVARLGDRLNTDARAKLAGLSIDGDLPAIQGFKAGFLNQVFFAALDLLRCERVTTAACGPTTGSVGVALGWAQQNATGWSWDCSYRHDWRVPTGQALAFLGGRCADPCDLYRDRLDAMINAFEVPVTPAKADPPTGGGRDPGNVRICLDPNLAYRKGILWDLSDCNWVKIPPPKIDREWTRKWIEIDVGDPPEFKPSTPWEVYGIGRGDPMESGTLGLEGMVGRRATEVQTTLDEIVTGLGLKSDVIVVEANQVDAIEGYGPALNVSVADQIVLTQDALGKLVGVGSVPAAHAVRTAAVEVPRATAAAGRAEVAAQTALETAGTLTDRVAEVDQQVAGLGTFQNTMLQWQAATDKTLGGLSLMIATDVRTAVNDLQLKVNAQVDERVGAAINTVRGGILDQVRAEITNAVGAARADVTRDIHVTSDALRAELKADQVTLSTQVGEIGQQVVGLSTQVDSVARRTERTDVRIDQVLASSATGPIRPRTPEFDRDVVGVLDTMRSSIVSAATPAQREKVRTELAAGDEAFRRIQLARDAGAVDLTAEHEALGSVLESMTNAVEAAGAPAADVTRLRTDMANVLGRIR
jgi:hypothetical protein